MSDLQGDFIAPLAAIRAHAAALAQSAPLNDSQRAFIQHIAQMAATLQEHFSALPPAPLALAHILPPQQERLQAQLAGVYGYARLLCLQPASFGGASPTPEQAAHLRAIDALASDIARRCEAVAQAALVARREGRQQAPQPFDLAALIADYEPIWRYELRETAVLLNVTVADGLPLVWGYPYHTAALMTHLVGTIGGELVAYGQMAARAELRQGRAVFSVFCTGLALNEADIATLFVRDGRAHYRAQIARGGGALLIARRPGVGAEVGFTVPLAGTQTT